MENVPAKRNLPKIEELYGDVELATKFNDLNKLLNCQPKADWVKTNSFANDSKYLPIGVVEYLLTSIFTKWRLEIKSCQVIANSVVVSVRLFVLDPVTSDWDWQDGIGASPIQTKKGAPATDFAQVNTAAVQMAAPAAESYAFKDAAEKFGKLFGKDLNRKDEMNYEIMQDRKFASQPKVDLPEELLMVIDFAQDEEKIMEIYNVNKEYHSNPQFMQVLNKRKKEIKATANGNHVNA